MTEFPKHYDVVVTPQAGQDVMGLIEGLRSSLHTLTCERQSDTTHIVGFDINRWSEHPVYINALREVGLLRQEG